MCFLSSSTVCSRWKKYGGVPAASTCGHVRCRHGSSPFWSKAYRAVGRRPPLLDDVGRNVVIDGLGVLLAHVLEGLELLHRGELVEGPDISARLGADHLSRVRVLTDEVDERLACLVQVLSGPFADGGGLAFHGSLQRRVLTLGWRDLGVVGRRVRLAEDVAAGLLEREPQRDHC